MLHYMRRTAMPDTADLLQIFCAVLERIPVIGPFKGSDSVNGVALMRADYDKLLESGKIATSTEK